MDIQKVMLHAKIRVGEMADICGVSRMTIHLWKKGGGIHPLRLHRVEKILQAITSATNKKGLPITRTGKRDSDLETIKQIVIRHLKG